jgi:nucleotidyltransferase/DNA polymerase involved in DNA repair
MAGEVLVHLEHVTLSLPKTFRSLSSARISRRFSGFCRLCERMYSHILLIDGLVVVDPDTEREFLHHLPIDLTWRVGPVTRARLAEIGVLTIGQLAKTLGWSLERLLGPAAGETLAALAWNRDPREIQMHRRAGSAGAQVGDRQEACR